MTGISASLDARLSPAANYCVAFSGGCDSTVLLHAMAQWQSNHPQSGLRAVHVNHGLHPDAARWVAHCRAVCARQGVGFVALEVVVTDADASDLGPEAAARRARYAALADELQNDEILLTAHHRDDQVETVLLRLMRGAGVHGLGGIPAEAPLGRARMMRPLLDMSRAAILAAADEAGLTFVDDTSNDDRALDRNLLRHEVIPLLARRWPGMDRTVSRAAQWCRESAAILDELALADAAPLLDGESIDLNGLRALTPARRRNLLRRVLQDWQALPPSAATLAAGLDQLLGARPDAGPVMRWAGQEMRRYRNRAYLVRGHPDDIGHVAGAQIAWDGARPLDLGPLRGVLATESGVPGGFDAALLRRGLRVSFREGGERLRLARGGHRRDLKKLFQEAGIVPWMRGHVPLIYAGDRLIAAGDLWVDGDARSEQSGTGWDIRWQGHGRLT